MKKPQHAESFSDGQIVEKTLHDDKQLFSVLVDRYKNLVFRIALNNLKDRDAAQDVVQETFLNAYRNLERLDKPESFGSWLYSITNNVCKNMKRKEKHNIVSVDDIDKRLIHMNDDDEGSSFSEEMINALKNIVKKLPSKHQKIIEFRYTEGCSCGNIAKFLGISERSVFNRLYYARKLILKKFKEEGLT